MNTNTTITDRLPTIYGGVDRRSKPRIYDPFQAIVQGTDDRGEAFEFETVLDNLSVGGLYLRLTRCIEEGAKILVIIRLSAATHEDASPRVLMYGVVLRAEPKPGGACGVAVACTNHYFF